MKIDTSTTVGKIAVMQHFSDGKTIQFDNADSSSWIDFNQSEGEVDWDWGNYDYRIKPKTLNEAATLSIKYNVEHCEYVDGYHAGAIFGAQWQREQDSE